MTSSTATSITFHHVHVCDFVLSSSFFLIFLLVPLLVCGGDSGRVIVFAQHELKVRPLVCVWVCDGVCVCDGGCVMVDV